MHPSTDVAEAADTLITRGFKSMPVVDEQHRLLGVVSRSDLIRSRAREDGEVARDIDEILDSCRDKDGNFIPPRELSKLLTLQTEDTQPPPAPSPADNTEVPA